MVARFAAESLDKPTGGTEQAGVIAAPSDELHAEWQSGIRPQQRQRHRRHPEIGPRGAEDRIAGAREAPRCLARRGRRQDGIEFVKHRRERRVERIDAGDRAGILDRLVLAPALDELAKLAAEPVATLLIIAVKIV